MDQWYLEHLQYFAVSHLKDLNMIYDKPRWTKQEAREILKECAAIESATAKLRIRAKLVLEATAEVIPIRNETPIKEDH